MADENRIAAELLFIIGEHPYTRYIQCIYARDVVTEDSFAMCSISSTHWVDSRNCYIGNLLNTMHLYDLFGSFSDEDGASVKYEMLERIWLDSRVVLDIQGCNLAEWLEEMNEIVQMPDELMLFALCRTYNRHCLVICKERNWTTVACKQPMQESELLRICNVALVFLGNGTFGELKAWPFEQILPNPFTLEYLQESLSKIRGCGRPRSKPLNLVLPRIRNLVRLLVHPLAPQKDCMMNWWPLKNNMCATS